MALLFMPLDNNISNNNNPQQEYSNNQQNNSRVRLMEENLTLPSHFHQPHQPLPLNLDVDDVVDSLEQYYSTPLPQFEIQRETRRDENHSNLTRSPRTSSFTRTHTRNSSSHYSLKTHRSSTKNEDLQCSNSTTADESSEESRYGIQEKEQPSSGQQFLRNFSRVIEQNGRARERRTLWPGTDGSDSGGKNETTHSRGIRMEGRINRKSNQPRDYDGMVLKFKKKRKFL
eukprot:gb/GECH01008519.1/.p1 GENE.gb/GECH01008519.1/~~gb/GECH01008519.1/.p1  ORF type:complete len:229 (+),score=60.15 gb/GECH01008519.1/:1-687(+)